MKLKFIILGIIVLTFNFSFVNIDDEKPVNAIKKEFSQTYTELWISVDSAFKTRHIKTAITIVDSIYKLAVQDENEPQIIKSLLHLGKFSLYIDEESLIHHIHRFEKEIESAKSNELKAIIHSVTAELYWNYYGQNRWKYRDRSDVKEIQSDDIRTWSLTQIAATVKSHYLLSLKDKDRLKEVLTLSYSSILQTDDGYSLEPTLYDFLSKRAIRYLINSESEITKPIEEFVLDKPELHYLFKDFISLDLKSNDSSSNKLKALKLFQELESFHLHDKDPQILVDLTLWRLKYVYNNYAGLDKNEIYINTLSKLALAFEGRSVESRIYYLMASYYNEQGNLYVNDKNETYRWLKAKALKIAQQGALGDSTNIGAHNCRALINEIKYPSIKCTMEETIIPNQPSLLKLDYQNRDSVYFFIFKPSRKALDTILYKYNYQPKKIAPFFSELKPTNKFKVSLPVTGDYQVHHTEVKLPGLPAGEYIIFCSSTNDLTQDTIHLKYVVVECSNIALSINAYNRNGTQIRVLNRKTGVPFPSVQADATTMNNSDGNKKYVGHYVTDNNGIINVPPTSNKANIYQNFTFSSMGDTLVHNSVYVQNARSYNEPVEAENKTYFFTDRAIYRPGQTIHFKGIIIREEGSKRTIVPYTATEATFMDANYQKVSTLQLRSNEYGTFSGSFVIPTGKLNGNMDIVGVNGSVSFRVEEYKRPKFEVTIDELKKDYKLDEEISVEGFAKALSGFNISKAKVSYTVKRNQWMKNSYRYSHSYSSKQVAIGNTTTDEQGKFNIHFEATSDKSIDAKTNPVFEFEVNVDVTDINGETRSSSRIFKVSNTSLMLGSDIENQINILEKDLEFSIDATNLSNKAIDTKGTIRINKLRSPLGILLDRKWEAPDVFIMDSISYKQDFPLMIYNNENDPKNWVIEKEFVDATFNTGQSKKFNIKNLSTWSTGTYRIQLTSKDKDGNDIKFEKIIQLFSSQGIVVPTNEINWLMPLHVNVQPGDSAHILIGSKANVKVYCELKKGVHLLSKQWIDLNNNTKKISFNIDESHRGGLDVYFYFIYENRLFETSQRIRVDWKNKELNLSFETFRNKLLPGVQEEWSIKIKGPKGDKVAAEMMATLYDASLDKLESHEWSFNIFPFYSSSSSWSSYYQFNISKFRGQSNSRYYGFYKDESYPSINWFGYGKFNDRSKYKFEENSAGVQKTVYEVSSIVSNGVHGFVNSNSAPAAAKASTVNEPLLFSIEGVIVDSKYSDSDSFEIKNNEASSNVIPRTNFNETAFFYPHLRTDAEGNISIKFKIPESLTKWKMMGLAHTKELAVGMLFNELVTQKELMVTPNPPRFFREGDKLLFNSKVSNITKQDLNGSVSLLLFDALTMQPIDALCSLNTPKQAFNLSAGESKAYTWEISIPDGIQAITYRVTASSSNHSDAEEMTVPVLTNRMLVTESMPLSIRGNESKTYRFNKLIDHKSTTLKNHKLTFEFTSNPAWYAIQALPYLIEYPYECAEQTFSRLYANTLGEHIVNSSPNIKRVFDSWKNHTPDALLSNLEKNQELKAMLLQETPWVLQAKNQSEQQQKLALLFDLNKMGNETSTAINKLKDMQLTNGGWPWFENMPDNVWITQHIVSGLAKLQKLGVKRISEDPSIKKMLEKGITYMDNEMCERYKELIRMKTKNPNFKIDDKHITTTDIHYLYSRSFFKSMEIQKDNREAYNYYLNQAIKYWNTEGQYTSGLIALTLHRENKLTEANSIIKSFKETAIHSEELGMYWKEMSNGYYWYQAPIEQQALMMEVFNEINDKKSVDEMSIWLLKNKKTTNWKTTKATVEASYALLLRGTNWLAQDDLVDITLGSKTVSQNDKNGNPTEAGTGYFKISWGEKEFNNEMGNVKIDKKSDGIAWGALYWQYFEQLDKITPAQTPFQLTKQLFIEKQTAKGKELQEINTTNKLQIGDRIIVRIVLKSDRQMEYIHIKDMRASSFEPENVLSQYKYQDGLGYYETTKDASTNFFIANLNKGTYVFEYPLRVTLEGDFSNGITSIQCMYAPDFSAHSEGIRIVIGNK